MWNDSAYSSDGIDDQFGELGQRSKFGNNKIQTILMTTMNMKKVDVTMLTNLFV